MATKQNNKSEIELKQSLKKSILNSYPDLLDFDNSLAEYEQFVKRETFLKAKEDFIKMINKIYDKNPRDVQTFKFLLDEELKQKISKEKKDEK